MTPLSISQIGRRVGLRPSAIRYYERIGILQPAPRVAGQRRYDESALYRRACRCFSLEECGRCMVENQASARSS